MNTCTRRFGHHGWAAALGAVALASWQMPAQASVITYSYAGTVAATNYHFCTQSGSAAACTAMSNLMTAMLNQPFSATVVVDTATGSITSFSYGASGSPSWTGSGGVIVKSSTGLRANLSASSTSAQYNPNSALPGSGTQFNLLDLVGAASGFGDFVDGYATTFDLSAMTTTGGLASFSLPALVDFTVRLTSLTAQVDGAAATVSEPGTAALAGLAGLAALRSLRRRRVAAAA